MKRKFAKKKKKHCPSHLANYLQKYRNWRGKAPPIGEYLQEYRNGQTTTRHPSSENAYKSAGTGNSHLYPT